LHRKIIYTSSLPLMWTQLYINHKLVCCLLFEIQFSCKIGILLRTAGDKQINYLAHFWAATLRQQF